MPVHGHYVCVCRKTNLRAPVGSKGSRLTQMASGREVLSARFISALKRRWATRMRSSIYWWGSIFLLILHSILSGEFNPLDFISWLEYKRKMQVNTTLETTPSNDMQNSLLISHSKEREQEANDVSKTIKLSSLRSYYYFGGTPPVLYIALPF